MDRLATLSHLERMLFGESEEPKALPLSLLEDITNGFSDEQEIGSGGFAVVYKGDLQSRTIAVKKLSKTHMHEKEFHREVECLMNVKHKNIVRFLGYCADTQGNMERYNGKFVMADVHQRLLCFEYLPKGSLDKYITDASSGLEWRKRYQIIKGICEGLYYLHGKRIVHLDLKPANILLDSNMVPKIADFGLSRCFDENQTRAITSNIIGSIGYLAAEFYNGHITLKSDIYSLGIIIREILTGDKGYADISNVVESWRNRLEKTQLGEAELEQIRVCAKIGIKCTKPNPAKRPVIEHIIHMFDEAESMDATRENIDEDHELRTQVKETEEDTNTCADSGASHFSGPGSTSIMDGTKSGEGEEAASGTSMASISVPDRVPSPSEDAISIRQAVEGWGDEEAIIGILGHRTAVQRAGIAVAYEDLYEEPLVDRLHSAFSSEFRDAMMMWTMDPAEYDAKLAYEALQNKRRNDRRRTLVLIEIACASLPGHLVAVKRCYRSTYASSLQRDVASCSRYEGPLKEFLVGLVSSDRPAGEHVDDILARADAAVLHSAVVVQKQPLHEDVIRIVSSRSKPQLKATVQHYKQQHGKAIDEVLEENWNDYLSAVLKTVVWCFTSPEKHFAEVIRNSVIGLGCDEETLTRVIISRAEIDMKKVKEEYKARYRTTVTDDILGDTSGYYKDMLLTLVGPE